MTTQPSLNEEIWNWLHKKSIRTTRVLSALQWCSWKIQCWLYYKWAKLYETRIQGELNEKAD